MARGGKHGKDMEALIRHLESRGAEIVSTKSHSEVRFHGRRIATLGRQVNLAVSDIKREAHGVELLEDYTGPGSGKQRPKPATIDVVPKQEKVTARDERPERMAATRMRIDDAIFLFGPAHGAHSRFARHVVSVGAEVGVCYARGTVSWAISAIKAWGEPGTGRVKVPIKMLDLIDLAIDEAWRNHAEENAGRAHRQPEHQLLPPSPPELTPEMEVESMDPIGQVHEEPQGAPGTSGDLREDIAKRYIDLLLRKAEEGDEAAMERLEKISGL